MGVQDSQAYRKMDVTKENFRRILELGVILLSFQFKTGFNLVNAAAVCATLESVSGLETPSVITAKRRLSTLYFHLSTITVYFAHKILISTLIVGKHSR